MDFVRCPPEHSQTSPLVWLAKRCRIELGEFNTAKMHVASNRHSICMVRSQQDRGMARVRDMFVAILQKSIKRACLKPWGLCGGLSLYNI